MFWFHLEFEKRCEFEEKWVKILGEEFGFELWIHQTRTYDTEYVSDEYVSGVMNTNNNTRNTHNDTENDDRLSPSCGHIS